MNLVRTKTLGGLMLALLLIPSALFLWRNSDLPQFGDFHDDGVYYVSAKSLAEGTYRIESLPGAPAQTKFPPLYPLLLSVAWHLDSRFPQNLRIAAWISWLAFPALLVLLARYYPRLGIVGWRRWLLLALIAVNPYSLWFGATLLSEWLFMALLIGVLLLVESAASKESGVRIAVAAGALAGLSCLTRSAGIVLLASGFVYLWWFRREKAKAFWFAGGMLPFVAGWMLWARMHQVHTSDLALIYYVDYMRYQIYNVTLHNLHLVLWKNVDGFLYGLGSLMLPKVIDSLLVKIIAEVIAVAMISGAVRLVRRSRNRAACGAPLHYVLFAAASAFLLIIWHFPPNERFVLPLFPLALAGLLTEMEHFAGMLRAVRRHPDQSQRIAGALLACMAGAILLGAFALQVYVGAVSLPHNFADRRARNADRQSAYGWLRIHAPAEANVVAYADPVTYLYTARRSIRLPLPPFIWYGDDHALAVEMYRQLPAYAQQQGAGYVLALDTDRRLDMSASDADAIEQAIHSNPELTPVYQSGSATVYRVGPEEAVSATVLRPSAAYTAAPINTITSPGQVVLGR